MNGGAGAAIGAGAALCIAIIGECAANASTAGASVPCTSTGASGRLENTLAYSGV